MHSILLSLLLIPSFYQAIQSDEAPGRQELEIIINELDLALDNFFSLLGEQDLDVFVAGVRHAARARSYPCPPRSAEPPACAATRCSWTSSSCDSGREVACSYSSDNRMDSQSESSVVSDVQQRPLPLRV